MARRGLTDEELARELEDLSDFDEITGFSDDSIADRDFFPDSSDSEEEFYESNGEANLSDRVHNHNDGAANRSDEAASSESEYSSDDNVPLATLITNKKWEPVSGDRTTFAFTPPQTGAHPDVVAQLTGKDPIDYFKHFIDDEIMSLLVTETNRFAAQSIASNSTKRLTQSRLQKWVDTDIEEMQKFLGIVLWMGLIQLPQLRDYWSTNMLYGNNIPKIMSRNRFEMLLAMLHTCDNEGPRDPDDRLFKISKFLDILQPKFKSSYIPEELVCIDESNVPFRGRIHFRQYIPNKRHKYGIKVFKLCVSGGYTWSFKVYTGKERAGDISVAEKIVTELMDSLLDSGRTVYTDNWYTSVRLSKQLINRDTHLVGTLRQNRRNNPSDVVNAKLKKGQVVAQQNEDKTVVLKWKDKRDVLMLSTKHDDSMLTFLQRGKELSKPAMVVEYNKGKAFIDLSDQMAAYSPYVRRTVKWYKRLLFHLITSTAMVNSLHLYNVINNKKIDRKSVV